MKCKCLVSDRMFGNKAIAGVTTLIILVAALLVAVVSTIYYIGAGAALEQSAFTVSERSKAHLTRKFMIEELSSDYISNGRIRDFEMTIKLMATSDPLPLEKLELVIQTKNESVSLSYRNGTTAKGPRGYKTFGKEFVGYVSLTSNYTFEGDLDDDALADYVTMSSSGAINIDFSSAQTYTIPAAGCAGAWHTVFSSVRPSISQVAEIYLDGYCGGLELPENATFVITPANYGRGYYAAEYLKRSDKRHLDGRVSRGDIVKLYFEMIEDLEIGDEVTITLLPSEGNPTEKRLVIPESYATGRYFFD